MNCTPDRPSYWVPNTNVFVSPAGHLIIKVELSGITSTGLQISIEGNKLTIKGKRDDPEAVSATHTLVNEINIGPFESVLELPTEYDLAKASSNFLNGVLRIAVPRNSSPQLPPQISLEG